MSKDQNETLAPTSITQQPPSGAREASLNQASLKEFGARLRAVREVMPEEKQRTQAGFAALLKISPGYLSQLESGKKSVSVDFVLDVAKIAKISPASLFTSEPRLGPPVAGFDEAIRFL